ncbi:hypothetical protein [Trinickia sp. EG282A]|uniref:hypothetical protein n=1 Tax=Trinickia sp. EG282A TaxID=3237013 RepID=UPI0034D38CC1
MTATATPFDDGSNPANAAAPVPHATVSKMVAATTIDQVRIDVDFRALIKALMMATSSFCCFSEVEYNHHRWPKLP